MFVRKVFIIIFLCLGSVLTAMAQPQSPAFTEVNKDYRRALELFDKEKYVPAAQAFEQNYLSLLAKDAVVQGQNWDLIKINAAYYYGISALELYNKNGENELLKFADEFQENPRARSAYFSLARFHFRERRFDTALYWFNKMDEFSVDNGQLSEYYFKSGYCNFYAKQYDKAAEKFRGGLDLSTKYTYPTIYYYAYIAYLKKDYKTAIESFLRLKQSKVYYETAVNFLLQLYYYSGKYDELLKFAKEVGEEHKLNSELWLHNYSAKAYFKKENYTAATSSYTKYFANDSTHTAYSQEFYESGYAHYALNEVKEAETDWTKTTSYSDSYAQNAFLALANLYLKDNKYTEARDAFKQVTNNGYDKKARETGEFQYAKLSEQLQFYQVAVDKLQEYITKYPKGAYTPEAKSLLGEALLNTKKYADAVRIIEGLETRTPDLNRAYQAACYYRGVEIYNDKDLNTAITFFDKAISNPVDKQIMALANYWKGEAFYTQGKLPDAINAYKNYNAFNNGTNDGVFTNVNYNLGYCSFIKEEYSTAAFYFDKYLNIEKKESKLYADALLRFADCNFVLKNYDKALFNYNKVINEHKSNSDYALFQKAMINGVQNRLNDKVAILQNITQNYPQSLYADDAQYEIANGYFNLNEIKNATSGFEELIKKYPSSNYIPKARLSLGLIYFNSNLDEQAMVSYKSIVADYPGSQEAREALAAIKNIYVENGKSDEYLSYLSSIPFAQISTGYQDSTTYEAAYNIYIKNEPTAAANSFSNYLEKFPDGSFATDAHYYRAECLIRNKQADVALPDYEYVSKKNGTKYTEKALLMVARISYDAKNYDKAITYYKETEQYFDSKENYKESLIGQMNCYFEQKNYSDALNYAEKVYANEKSGTDEQNHALLIKGKCQFFANNITEATGIFAELVKATKTESGAESKYYLALIQYNAKNYDEAKKIAFDLSRQIPSYDYWIAKGFIILADCYAAQGNTLQAKSTLQSIIDEYDGNDDVLPTAKEKLEKLFEIK